MYRLCGRRSPEFRWIKQKRRTEEIEDRSVRMKKLFSYYKVLMVAVMAMGMVATFSDGIASADHVAGDGVSCDSGVR